MRGLAVNLEMNLPLAHVICVCLLCVISVSTPSFSSAAFQSSDESDSTWGPAPPQQHSATLSRFVGAASAYNIAYEMNAD